MTTEIAIVLFILGVSVVFLISEWIPMEVTALLVLGSVALTGLVSPRQALAGFSNPAVITIWAVFIISGGLTRTGIAKIIGRLVLKVVGRSEAIMIAVIMTTAGAMSAVMNNVAVAALMLPVVMDIARNTATSPSRLLLPLAYGSLLGGLTTQIGTPPNILVTGALRDAGLTPFSFFDFTPVGLAVMIAGTAYMALIGRHLLPQRDVAKRRSDRPIDDWRKTYALQKSLFHITIRPNAKLIGKTIAQSRIGSAMLLNVIGISRRGQILLSPGPGEVLKAGDILTVQGDASLRPHFKLERDLIIEEESVDLEMALTDAFLMAETVLPAASGLIGRTLNTMGFRGRFNADVLAIHRDGWARKTNLADLRLKSEDTLLLAGLHKNLAELQEDVNFGQLQAVDHSSLRSKYRLHESFLFAQLPQASVFANKTLKENRLAETLGGRVMVIYRPNGHVILPAPTERLKPGDRLLVECQRDDFAIMQGLEELEIEHRTPADMGNLETDRYGIIEVILSPHSILSGQTLRQLNFREKFGLNVLSIWRGGEAYYTNLRDTALKFGDALLMHGPREKLKVLGHEPDFVVLTETAQERFLTEKAWVSLLILTGTLFPVFMGWLPIYIAAVVGAALMILTKCLSMDEAYRQIEWKAVFLIAGMLPLGTALDQTGAARLIAENVVAWVGPYGPQAVMAGMLILTFLATCFVPTAALVVLMVPIVLNTASDMGLSPYSLVMAIAMAASASFTTPISHPANILVMAPGGYKFLDYLKVGGSLTLVILVVLLWVLPLFWPLMP